MPYKATISTTNNPRPRSVSVPVNGSAVNLVEHGSLDRALWQTFSDIQSISQTIQQPATRQGKQIVTNYLMTASDETILANAANGSIVVTLLDATTLEGQLKVIQKTDSSANTVTPKSKSPIQATVPPVLNSQYQTLRLEAHNGKWWVV